MTRRPSRAGKPGSSPPSAPGHPTPFVPPYPPSWVDRATDSLDRLPGPAWLAFVGLAAVGVLVQLGIQASREPGSVRAVAVALALPVILRLIQYVLERYFD